MKHLYHEALYFDSYFNDSIMFFGGEGTKFRVDFDDFKRANKAKNALIFDNSIEIGLENNLNLFLTSFLTRDNAYRVILNRLRKVRSRQSFIWS